jgi:hypothetical protein
MRPLPGLVLLSTLALFAFKKGRFVPLVIVLGCILDELV